MAQAATPEWDDYKRRFGMGIELYTKGKEILTSLLYTERTTSPEKAAVNVVIGAADVMYERVRMLEEQLLRHNITPVMPPGLRTEREQAR